MSDIQSVKLTIDFWFRFNNFLKKIYVVYLNLSLVTHLNLFVIHDEMDKTRI